MQAWAFVGVLMASLAPVPASDVEAPFAAAMPEAVVDVSGWETIDGEFETPVARGAYVFHVNPRLQAIYQVMRYRVELLSPATKLQRRRGSGERVAFIREPGAHEPMLCWERGSTGRVPAWRALEAGTAEYKLEMAVLMQVIAVHRANRVLQAR